jgi:hypothetical protein
VGYAGGGGGATGVLVAAPYNPTSSLTDPTVGAGCTGPYAYVPGPTPPEKKCHWYNPKCGLEKLGELGKTALEIAAAGVLVAAAVVLLPEVAAVALGAIGTDLALAGAEIAATEAVDIGVASLAEGAAEAGIADLAGAGATEVAGADLGAAAEGEATAAADSEAGIVRVFRSEEGAGLGGDGPNLSLDEARAAAESRGVDTTCMRLCYQPKTDPSWRPNTYGFSRFTMSDQPYVDANGLWEVTLTDLGLQDEETAAWTIAHELGHLTEVGPWDEAGAEAFAARLLGGG